MALLFRTLDAFRIFDNIYVLTGGTSNTDSVSMLGYDNLFKGFNVGLGSAISVLIFGCVALIAFVFIKVFGAAAPGGTAMGAERQDGEPIGARRSVMGWSSTPWCVLYALIPVLWILQPVAQAHVNGQGRQVDSVVGDVRQLPRHLPRQLLQLGAAQLGRDRADHHRDRGGDRRDGGLCGGAAEFPGQRLLIGAALLIAMFPPISLVTPLFNIERAVGLFDTWPGLILPYITFALAAGHLHACRRSSGRSRGIWRRRPKWTAPRRRRRSAR